MFSLPSINNVKNSAQKYCYKSDTTNPKNNANYQRFTPSDIHRIIFLNFPIFGKKAIIIIDNCNFSDISASAFNVYLVINSQIVVCQTTASVPSSVFLFISPNANKIIQLWVVCYNYNIIVIIRIRLSCQPSPAWTIIQIKFEVVRLEQVFELILHCQVLFCICNLHFAGNYWITLIRIGEFLEFIRVFRKFNLCNIINIVRGRLLHDSSSICCTGTLNQVLGVFIIFLLIELLF